MSLIEELQPRALGNYEFECRQNNNNSTFRYFWRIMKNPLSKFQFAYSSIARKWSIKTLIEKVRRKSQAKSYGEK